MTRTPEQQAADDEALEAMAPMLRELRAALDSGDTQRLLAAMDEKRRLLDLITFAETAVAS